MHDKSVQVDVFHVHITAGRVTIGEQRFTSGVGPAMIDWFTGGPRVAATVGLDDGTTARVRIRYEAVTDADVASSDADVHRPGCRAGTRT